MSESKISRRSALGFMAGAAALAAAPAEALQVKGNLKQSVCKWCYPKISLDDLCQQAKTMGIQSVELLGPDEWDVPKKYGLTCAMPSGLTGISDGWNDPARHDYFIDLAGKIIPKVKASGYQSLIVFSGNRRDGLTDEQGLANCAKGLKQIMPMAEREGVTIQMELLNSKVDHKNYMCDHTVWGAKLVDTVASDRFKLLYDIYHMQIMEGDVIRTIRTYKNHIGHFHTGGVPGRNEIDESQELNYKTIAEAIVNLGFKGYFAHEFIPKRDPMTSLKAAVQLCDV